MQVLYFFEVLLQQPIVPVALGLIVAVLYGAGRAAGLPRLFWHEKPGHRFLAGLATTFLAAQCLLDTYLLDAHRRFPGREGFYRYLELGAAGWILIVLVRSAELWFRRTYPHSVPASRARAVSVTPLIHPGGSSESVGVYAHPGAFLAGVAAAIGTAILLVATLWQVRLPDSVTSLLAFLDDWRHVEDPRLHALQAVLFVSLLVLFVVLRTWATPAIGICLLLALVLAAQSAIDFWLRNAGFGLLILLALLWWAGRSLRKLRVPALRALYATPVPYPPSPENKPPDPTPLRYDAGLDARSLSRRLVVICASGGGIRAATWTAAILGRLDEEVPKLRGAIRLVTGASGGMVGAASWVALLHGLHGRAPAPESWRLLANAVAKDSLTPVARRLIFNDIPSTFAPWVNEQDRGIALEQAWLENLRDSPLHVDLGLTFADLRAGELAADFPTLVFSPMIVEDGRRLILSNRALSELTDLKARWLSSKESETRPSTTVASQSAYHIADLFPTAWATLPISTAARLSAAFPFASPAVVLPTEPRRRVVDAGYYDNYGLDLASSWLRSLLQDRRDWLKENISGILLIQIRDNVSQLSVNPASDRTRTASTRPGDTSTAMSRGFEGITSPLSGVLSARESVMLFRNDSQLETVSELYAGALGSDDFLTTTIFEFRGGASLSWTLASDEVELLTGQAGSEKLGPKIKAIADWMNESGYWARA